MPLIFSERWGTSTRVAVWSAEEDQDYFLDRLDLTADDLALVRSMHPRRALEWCASRYLLARMIGRERARRCTKDDHGKPVIPGDAIELSISHSYGMAAVIVSDRHRVGIDVQRQTAKILRVQQKFVSSDEARTINAAKPEPQLRICWGAKEALFKVYALGQIDFRKHLSVDLPRVVGVTGWIRGSVQKAGTHVLCDIRYRFIQNYTLVYALEV